MPLCDAVPKIIGCFSKLLESGVFWFCIIYANYHLWPFLGPLPCVWQSLSHCERHSVHWNALIKLHVPLQLAQFLWHRWTRQAWGIFFSKEGFEKTLWTANRRPACEWWKKIPSVPRTSGDTHYAGCFEPALWLAGHLAHSPVPQRPSLCTTKCKCHLKGLFNPDAVKHLVLELPSAAMKGMRFFL